MKRSSSSSKKRLRALGVRNALRCEEATTPPSSCECRCKGAAHGKGRTPLFGGPVASLWELPKDDPHWPGPPPAPPPINPDGALPGQLPLLGGVSS